MSKDILYRLLFDEDKTRIEKLLNLTDFERLEESLDNLSVLDLACGSGAFLVGMLNVLVETYKTIYRHLKRDMTDYQLKKRIIGNSLYGVDVMPWAVHSAELRLWLSLMIESDLTLGELKLYPLLPNLNLKLRIGDSLIQEIAGINLNLRDIGLSQSLKRKLSDLKREKEKYYNNDPTAKFKTEEGFLHEELRIFYEILDEKIINLNKKRQSLTTQRAEQLKIFEDELSQKELFDEKKLRDLIEKQKKLIDEEVKSLKEIRNKLKEKKPFVWDIDFAEIFGEKGGFDIVIGNPPYVRQEKIAPPNKLKNEITNEQKKEYKEKLLKSVQACFPFIKSIDKKSDYYVYFYFIGLSLLNAGGTFCFITSNSWLDVGYGKDLQEFLLKFVPIIAICDNQAKRSFEHADINTIIVFFGAPYKSARGFPALQNISKFVIFKKPFEEVVNAENLLKIEKAESPITADDFRVYPKKQEDLLEESWEYPDGIIKEQKKAFKFDIGKYTANKWGGKYLRAPDIFYTILEKGVGKFSKLGEIAKVITVSWSRQGQNSRLMSSKLIKASNGRTVDVLKSPKDVAKINLTNADTCYRLKLEKWVKNQVEYAPILWVDLRGDKHICHRCLEPIAFTHNFHGITPYEEDFTDTLCAFLNSTLSCFLTEVLGRRGLGGGAVRILVEDLRFQFPVLEPSAFTSINRKLITQAFKDTANRQILKIFDELGINPHQPIRSQRPNPIPDRKALDDVVFDILGLTQAERDEVYWAVCELVKNRLEKAKSV